MASPFPYIEEIKDLENITGFNDVLKILGAVYSLIPWTTVPYTGLVLRNDLESLYRNFKELKSGGWCGLNAEYFKWLIEGYKRKDLTINFRSYNYGLSFQFTKKENSPSYMGFTHLGILVEIDKMEFFFDPYFARYFIHTEGFPLQFKDLMFLISEKKFDKYKSVFLPLKKPVIRENGLVDYLSPQVLMKEVFEFFEQQGLKKTLQDIFGTENPDSLMLIKIPD